MTRAFWPTVSPPKPPGSLPATASEPRSAPGPSPRPFWPSRSAAAAPSAPSTLPQATTRPGTWASSSRPRTERPRCPKSPGDRAGDRGDPGGERARRGGGRAIRPGAGRIWRIWRRRSTPTRSAAGRRTSRSICGSERRRGSSTPTSRRPARRFRGCTRKPIRSSAASRPSAARRSCASSRSRSGRTPRAWASPATETRTASASATTWARTSSQTRSCPSCSTTCSAARAGAGVSPAAWPRPTLSMRSRRSSACRSTRRPSGFKYIGEKLLAGEIIFGGEESAGLTVEGHVPEKDGILADLLCAELVGADGEDHRPAARAALGRHRHLPDTPDRPGPLAAGPQAAGGDPKLAAFGRRRTQGRVGQPARWNQVDFRGWFVDSGSGVGNRAGGPPVHRSLHDLGPGSPGQGRT